MQAMLPDADHGTTFPPAVVMKGTHDSNSISSPGHSRRIHVQHWNNLATDGATLKVEMPGGAQQWRWSSACEYYIVSTLWLKNPFHDEWLCS